MDTTSNHHHTRAATRAGAYPAPPPLFSPQAHHLSFGSVGAEEMLPLADDVYVPAVTSVTRPASAASALSAGFPSPVLSKEGSGAAEFPLAPAGGDEDGGWTPVTRKTSRSHRESPHSNRNLNTDSFSSSSKSSESDAESTIAKATHELSALDLQ